MTTRALPSSARASHWRPSLYALAILASCTQPPDQPNTAQQVSPAVRPTPGVPAEPHPDPERPRPVNPCECGPIDVVFVVDTTGSMGPALNTFKAGFPALLQDIKTSSSNDYHFGLVTFKDNINVVQDLALLGDAAVLSSVAGLPAATGGGAEPEASDEALDTVLNHLSSAGRPQTGNFFGQWRTGARRFVVLITDAHPGGFDNVFGTADSTHAQLLAQKANDDEVKLHAVYVTHGAPIPTIKSVMQGYASTSHGLYRQTLPNGADMYMAVRDFLSGCRTPSDVYIKDDPTDIGNEPTSVFTSIYYSPDIKVCNNPGGVGCTWPGITPVFGSLNNHVVTTLRNDRPSAGPVSGSLYVYYTAAGGGAMWTGSGSPDWTLIGVQHGVFMNPGETRDVAIAWTVPVPSHYCLLARWVSAGDPMTFMETYNSTTLTNARNNNNIAWRNVDVVRFITGTLTDVPFTWTDVPGGLATLVIKPETVLPGKAVMNLGGLFDGWKRNGGKGSGIEVISDTELLISADGGTVEGVPAPDEGRASVTLSFTVDKAGTWPVRVSQLADGERGPEDQGGVEYRLVSVDPDEPATAPAVAAIVDAKGGVALSWTHDVQHTSYTIWRSDRPDFEPKEGEPIAALDAKDADVKSALTFTDRAGAEQPFYYRVQSHGTGGDAFSDIATASPGSNADN